MADPATFGACAACLAGSFVIPATPAATIRRNKASGFGTCVDCGAYGLVDVEEGGSAYCMTSRIADCRYGG